MAIDLHSPWELRMITASVDGTGEPVSVCSLDAGVSAEWLGAIERQRAVLLWAYEDVFAAERFFESRVVNRVIDPPMLAGVALGMAPLTLRAWFGEEQWRHPLFAATPPPWRLLRRHEEEELPNLRA
ncbi:MULTISPECIES: hypothetical protein [unclassified Microbacterium]|uniref:hypothetical protein n=1 Tax=unclassified Microbacterium TaxID=2609290 RepID=UPI0022EFF957|nr:hypothetical protein [Streptomyces sp. MS2A]